MLSEDDLDSLLSKFLSAPSETEVFEFKTAGNDYNFDKLGKYFSALSNEANLRYTDDGWLIFGVDDNRRITGTGYRKGKASLDSRLWGNHITHPDSSNNLTL